MRILIVDDQPTHLLLLTTFLEGIGYAVATAQNGQEALSYLHDTPELPQMILLDLAMPSMTGWDFLQAQQQELRFAAIPVIVMTALGLLTHSDMPAQVIAFLEKPIDLGELEHLLYIHSPSQLHFRQLGM